MAEPTLEETIEQNAKGPRKVSGDTGSVEQHSIQDQIAADEYVSGKTAARTKLGIKHVKLVPPGGGGV